MEWIKTSEKTPEINEMCLVVRKGKKYIDVLYWDEHYKSWNDHENDEYECEALDVDCWMPMPDLPKDL